MSLLSKDRCWYVNTNERIGKDYPPMTYAEAVLFADLLVANKHKGVEIHRGQLQMVIA
tara:strand:+ start:928 stop:1101 length:174 start_codon:yes stop_codon:yes gene_type:complete